MITVTDKAAGEIKRIITQENDAELKLRMGVQGGGCSGFSYQYDLIADDRTDEDIVIEGDGAVVLIDPISLQYMAGSEVDFVNDLMGQSFQIRNPNAVASCGCGTSFSV